MSSFEGKDKPDKNVTDGRWVLMVFVALFLLVILMGWLTL